ncbi:hypothetical protein KIW84_UN0490 [Lathyrus oleraceus]|nr:hypothetical protein KIW84_UN0490 [Pisum sativum]
MDVIDSHMENLSSQEIDDDEVSRHNEEDDDYNCCKNDDDDDDGICSGWYQHHDEAGDYNGCLLIEELEDKQRLIQKKITKLEQKLEDYKREMDVIDSHMENLSSQEIDDDEVSRHNEEDDDYNCCKNDDDDDDGICSGWYQHHDEAGDYNGCLLIEELEDKQRLIQKKITKLEQKLEDYKREMDVIDSHMENLSSQEIDDDEVSRHNEEDDDYNCCKNDDDDDDGICSGWYQHHDEAGDYNGCLLIEELEDKQRLIQKKITKLEQKLEDYKREMDVIDSHMENLSSQEIDDDEVSRHNEEDDDYNCCQNDDDDDDGICSGWYQHHDEAGDYNGWYQYHDEAGDYNSWYQHHEEDDEHNGLDQQYAPVQTLYLAADNHDHALNLTLNEAPSKNLIQNQPEEVTHTENLLAADNDDPIQKFSCCK